jgi:hypothetical protein
VAVKCFYIYAQVIIIAFTLLGSVRSYLHFLFSGRFGPEPLRSEALCPDLLASLERKKKEKRKQVKSKSKFDDQKGISMNTLGDDRHQNIIMSGEKMDSINLNKDRLPVVSATLDDQIAVEGTVAHVQVGSHSSRNPESPQTTTNNTLPGVPEFTVDRVKFTAKYV